MRRLWMLVAMLLLAAAPARAWPDRPIQLVVPFPAGGVIDIVARGLAQAWTERLGVAVAVVNRDGAAGSIGIRALATSAADGYTLALTPTPPLTVQPLLIRNAGYSVASLRPICRMFAGHFALVAGRGGPADAAAAVAAARAMPGAVSFGYGGNGTIAHFAMLSLQNLTRVEFNPIPFRGDPPIVTALLAGDLQLAILALGNAAALRDRLQVVMVFSGQRIPELAGVPTATELGFPLVEAQFGGLFAPAGVPAPVVERLDAECARVLDDPRVADALRATRFARSYQDSRDFEGFIQAEAETKRGLVAAAGLGPQ
jgi:tripartite-type tricarboxylate transporter receptor subunit TctC